MSLPASARPCPGFFFRLLVWLSSEKRPNRLGDFRPLRYPVRRSITIELDIRRRRDWVVKPQRVQNLAGPAVAPFDDYNAIKRLFIPSQSLESDCNHVTSVA